MAADTPPECRDAVIYQCFVRQHSRDGTLDGVTADIPRIASLGVDVLYLLPISPIGEEGRKGTLGSPYAIRDYRAIDPALGDEEDFSALVDAANGHGLRVMLDVVFNHTARDSVLLRDHPEFYRRDTAGRPVTSVPAWHDIIDLDHDAPGLSDYLIETLHRWARAGVRGFRCDVASLVPVSLWARARTELGSGIWWLAETPHTRWVAERREAGLRCATDAEMFEAFDMAYQYDLWPVWQTCVRGGAPVSRFLEMVRWQQAALPGQSVRLRFVENHDNYRITRFARTPDAALAWTALMAFLPGPFLIYAGQESGATHWPSLFEKEPVAFGDYGRSEFLRRTTDIMRLRRGVWRVVASHPVVLLAWETGAGGLLGVFDVEGVGSASVPLPDGTYEDLHGSEARVAGGRLHLSAPMAVLRYSGRQGFSHEHSDLLDTFLHVELGDDLG